MKSPHYSLADEELLEYADRHIAYEIQMLVWTAGILGTVARAQGQGTLAWACNCAMLESFSIHARNLIDFLYSHTHKKDRKSDIIAEDYIDGQTLSQHLPPRTPRLERACDKANKQTAHLTWERIQYEQSGKQWEFIEIGKEIMNVFRSIAPVFPETRISDSFRQLISQPGLVIPEVSTYLLCPEHDAPPAEIAFHCTLIPDHGVWKVKGARLG
jgi:hypothetical protein